MMWPDFVISIDKSTTKSQHHPKALLLFTTYKILVPPEPSLPCDYDGFFKYILFNVKCVINCPKQEIYNFSDIAT